tara:strand:- start:915 stop:1205 length:291 start_codon:yes stop_codon:yes gene_type:complete
VGLDLSVHPYEHYRLLLLVDLCDLQAHPKKVFVKLHILFAVSDKLRRAINYHHGKSGQATRQEVKSWLWQHGHSRDDEILAALYEHENDQGADSKK